MQYQEVRAAAFQPVMHYGAVPQASAGGPGQAPYGVPTGGGMHYVRGVKDIQGQGVRDWNSKHRSFYLQIGTIIVMPSDVFCDARGYILLILELVSSLK